MTHTDDPGHVTEEMRKAFLDAGTLRGYGGQIEDLDAGIRAVLARTAAQTRADTLATVDAAMTQVALAATNAIPSTIGDLLTWERRQGIHHSAGVGLILHCIRQDVQEAVAAAIDRFIRATAPEGDTR